MVHALQRGLVMMWILATSPDWSITIVRITLGVILFAHGAQKVLGWFGGHGLRGTVGFLTSTGLPVPIAYAVCFFEFLGGLGLISGFLTRPSALAILIVMVGAIVKVHARNGFFVNWELTPGKRHGVEVNLAYAAMAIACLMSGGGALAFDAVLAG